MTGVLVVLVVPLSGRLNLLLLTQPSLYSTVNMNMTVILLDREEKFSQHQTELKEQSIY